MTGTGELRPQWRARTAAPPDTHLGSSEQSCNVVTGGEQCRRTRTRLPDGHRRVRKRPSLIPPSRSRETLQVSGEARRRRSERSTYLELCSRWQCPPPRKSLGTPPPVCPGEQAVAGLNRGGTRHLSWRGEPGRCPDTAPRHRRREVYHTHNARAVAGVRLRTPTPPVLTCPYQGRARPGPPRVGWKGHCEAQHNVGLGARGAHAKARLRERHFLSSVPLLHPLPHRCLVPVSRGTGSGVRGEPGRAQGEPQR